MQSEMKDELNLWRQKMPRKSPGRPKLAWEGLESGDSRGGKAGSAHGERAI